MTRRTGAETVASLIDYEAEATDVIFVGRDEVAALLGGGSIATERRTGELMKSPYTFKKYGQSGIELSER